MIERREGSFWLHTEKTTYGVGVLASGQLEHLYYGQRITVNGAEESSGEKGAPEALAGKHEVAPGNSILYSDAYPGISLEEARLEMSALGKGDVREPFLEVVHGDGSVTSDFVYESAVICRGKEPYRTLPGSYGTEDEVEHLCVTLADRTNGLELELHYYVYEAHDVITRSARLINRGEQTVRLKRLMSVQMDLEGTGFVFTTFGGAWAREMERRDVTVNGGRCVNASFTGTSSSRANPFVMLSEPETSEDAGLCYGCNLIYSGNHYESAETGSYGSTRFSAGINPQSFEWLLGAGEDFEAPEAVLTCSERGYSGVSRQMHRFVRDHIVRGEWQYKTRPVLLNSWEAAYFDINERKLLNLAKAGKEAGVELFVVDDGWFGTRTDDTRSLGDWREDRKKLPGGLSGLCEKVKELGMDFGIWVEPEMVSVKSRLYTEHPDYAMEIPGKAHSEGRNQRILDLTRTEVQDFVIEEMTRVFSSADISYVKWDMNRIFSDVYSGSLPPKRQGEAAHRYVLGLYRCMRILTECFPHILFEGCSAGGNRFDLGILCYFPQIWASDNTDAVCRADIQIGYSYGYPMSVLGSHVSACPNHQTLRVTPMETRFHVAAFGIFGYECDLCDMSREELAQIAAQIALYKKWRTVLQTGDFYRIREGNEIQWICVSRDQKQAVGFFMQKLARANSSQARFKAKGLLPKQKYHFYNSSAKYSIKLFGDLINAQLPVHIRQGSLLHEAAAKLVKLPGECEDYHLFGDALMYGGVRLQQAFCGTGYREGLRLFGDFASRLYFMEAEEI